MDSLMLYLSRSYLREPSLCAISSASSRPSHPSGRFGGVPRALSKGSRRSRRHPRTQALGPSPWAEPPASQRALPQLDLAKRTPRLTDHQGQTRPYRVRTARAWPFGSAGAFTESPAWAMTTAKWQWLRRPCWFADRRVRRVYAALQGAVRAPVSRFAGTITDPVRASGLAVKRPAIAGHRRARGRAWCG